jgi:hypothetical protein
MRVIMTLFPELLFLQVLFSELFRQLLDPFLHGFLLLELFNKALVC